MSHASVITDLKLLMKTPITAHSPGDHVGHLQGESARSAIILHGAMIEEMLVASLEEKMPNTNKDERDRLFHYEGPLGSFSNRIRMAHALGCISRDQRKKCEVIKEMRNTAAHCHAPINFDTPQIRAATAQLFHKPMESLKDFDSDVVRGLFTLAGAELSHHIMHPDDPPDWDGLWEFTLAPA